AFAALLSHFPHRTGRAAITDADWTHGFALTSAFHMSLVGPPCIDALDLDDDTPGPQYACTAWYELPAGTRTLPACDQVGTGTCWRLASHSPRCGLAELVHEVVLEQPLRHVPAGTQLALDCVSR
ncbi:MAG TPA: hypothetical protein VK427_27430, partial [Kofleriaceae bacterium]|nr:hypothetical protein [Kofleriaceae bacterium]